MSDALSLKPQPVLHDQPALFEFEPISPKDSGFAPDATEPALPLRSDTMLGVCEALGQDFGFNPNYLRIALGSLVLWNPVAAIGIYLGLGAVVALSRWLAPAQRPAAAPQLAADRETRVVPANANSAALSVAA